MAEKEAREGPFFAPCGGGANGVRVAPPRPNQPHGFFCKPANQPSQRCWDDAALVTSPTESVTSENTAAEMITMAIAGLS
jgi:hypothetical protein